MIFDMLTLTGIVVSAAVAGFVFYICRGGCCFSGDDCE